MPDLSADIPYEDLMQSAECIVLIVWLQQLL